MKTKVIVADPHPAALRGLLKYLEDEPAVTVVASHAETDTLVSVIESVPCDVLIADLSGSSRAADQVKDFLAIQPDLRILIYTNLDEMEFAAPFVRAGALGFLMKTAPLEAVGAAISRVAQWELCVSPSVAAQTVQQHFRSGQSDSSEPYADLTDRQIDVFRMIGRGLDTRGIAEELSLSVKTIEAHRATLREKLGLATGHELYTRAARWVESAGLDKPIKTPDSPIMIVDDNNVDLMVVNRVFTHLHLDNELETASRGEEALEILESMEELPSILIVDIRMPGMSGLDFLRAIKQHKKFRGIPVIIYSSSDEASDRKTALENGAAGFMKKPENFQDTVDLFKRINRYWSVSEFS